METLVWKYEIRKPNAFLRDNPEIWKLLRMAREYRRGLVDIEIQRKQRFDDLRREIDPKIVEREEAEVAAKEAFDEHKKAFSGVLKSKRQDSPEYLEAKRLKKALQDASAALKEPKKRVNEMFKPYDERAKMERNSLKEGLSRGAAQARSAANEEVLGRMLSDPAIPEFWKRKVAIDAQAHEERKKLSAEYQAKGLAPDHRELVDASILQALVKLKGKPLRHKRIEGGSLGYRRKGASITLDELFSGEDPWLTVDRLPDDQWSETAEHSARQGRKFARPKFKLRLRAKPDLWATGTIAMDRPFPGDVLVKSVKLVVTRVALQWKCSLQFTLTTAARSFKPVGTGRVAVHAGWRIRPGAIEHVGPNLDVERDWGKDSTRALYIVDDQGNEKEYRLSAKLRERERYSERVQSACDRLFNEARAAAVCLIENHPEEVKNVKLTRYENGEPVEETIAEATEHIAKWRAHTKLCKVAQALSEASGLPIEDLWKAWKQDRLPNKLDLHCSIHELAAWLETKGLDKWHLQQVVWLEWWRRKDQHLTQLYRAMNARNARKTKEYYRVVANQLASRYGELVLSEQKFAKQKEAPSVEDDNRTPQEEKAARNMHKASPGLAYATLKERFKGRVSIVKLENGTMIHHGCGCELLGNRKSDIMLQCAVTGEYVDQDANAAKNTLYGITASGSASQAAE